MDLDTLAALLPQAEAAEVAAALARLCPDDPLLPGAEALVRWGRGETAELGFPPPPGPDALFLDSIAAIRIIAASGTFPVARRIALTPESDFLARQRAVADWGIARVLNFVLLRAMAPRRRVAVVGTMRDDGLVALEWIAHYRALGADRIFVYTNDNADGSDALLKALAEQDVITLIDNGTSGQVSPQLKAFEHALHLLHDLRDYAYVFFLDSDEFFVPVPCDVGLPALLDALERHDPERRIGAVCYPWLWMLSGGAYARGPGLLLERFQHAAPHWLCKSLVRLADVQNMYALHVPTLRPGRHLADSRFAPIDPERIWDRVPAGYAGGRLNHYWNRSFEEFSLKKARGDALGQEVTDYRRGFDQFFAWNGAETEANRWPPPAELMRRLRAEYAALLALPGVAAAQAATEQRFPALLARFDEAGGLPRIYDGLKATPPAL